MALKKAPDGLFDEEGAENDPQSENKNKTEDDLDFDGEGQKDKQSVTLAMSKVVLANKLLLNIKENNDKLISLLAGLVSSKDEEMISIGQLGDQQSEDNAGDFGEGRIIEGVFDGENMIGPDGKQYTVPANYASKSKLVEGDILKLTITPRGTFVYKQIGPIERIRLIGRLEQEANGSFIVSAEGRKLKVLTASITYFKGQPGDEIVVLVPKNGESKWAAVENIVKDKI